MTGIYVPVALLAVGAIAWSGRGRKYFAALFCFSVLTNLFFILLMVAGLSKSGERGTSPQAEHLSTSTARRWRPWFGRENIRRPARCCWRYGNRVVCPCVERAPHGVWPPLRDPQRRGRERAVEDFYSGAMNAAQQSEFIQTRGVDYILASQADFALRICHLRASGYGLSRPRHDRVYRQRWVLLFLFPVALVAPVLGNFIYLRGAEFSDLAISHLPNALWIQRSLREWGQIPLWSNTILSGYPFAANPLSGLHYPPGWIALLFPQPLGLNLVMLLHLVAGGVGMYCFLRAEGLERLPAGWGAWLSRRCPSYSPTWGPGM